MICMAGLQVFIVRFFFQGARKGEFSFGSDDCSMLILKFRICIIRR